MNALAEEIRREVLAAHVGTEDEVLLETPLSETLFTGYTRLYIPVVVSAPGHKSGEIVHVRLGEYDGVPAGPEQSKFCLPQSSAAAGCFLFLNKERLE